MRYPRSSLRPTAGSPWSTTTGASSSSSATVASQKQEGPPKRAVRRRDVLLSVLCAASLHRGQGIFHRLVNSARIHLRHASAQLGVDHRLTGITRRCRSQIQACLQRGCTLLGTLKGAIDLGLQTVELGFGELGRPDQGSVPGHGLIGVTAEVQIEHLSRGLLGVVRDQGEPLCLVAEFRQFGCVAVTQGDNGWGVPLLLDDFANWSRIVAGKALIRSSACFMVLLLQVGQDRQARIARVRCRNL